MNSKQRRRRRRSGIPDKPKQYAFDFDFEGRPLQGYGSYVGSARKLGLLLRGAGYPGDVEAAAATALDIVAIVHDERMVDVQSLDHKDLMERMKRIVYKLPEPK